MLHVVLIDDEMPALSELAYIIENSGLAEVTGRFTDSVEGLLFVQNTEPDIVFLDINMPQMNGLKLAEAIGGLNLSTAIVFATAYDEHALEAFEKDAIDYILKPYEEERVKKVLRKVEARRHKDSHTEDRPQKAVARLPIPLGDKIIFIPVKDILFCKVEENTVYVHTEDGAYQMTESLSKIEAKLPANLFFKTHRAYIVNLKKVKEVSPYFNHTLMIQFDGSNEEVPVSRSNVKSFKKRLNI
ncbi:LytR/AlgR family response regulator transcription factor [Fusibacter sp. JL216-2]|uniref:LytR/AlgR family response regulator transcription factor n=1 Tax=Fusibacter sp. JL216-2 TaxID=3071453 RepID=UPI003D33114E